MGTGDSWAAVRTARSIFFLLLSFLFTFRSGFLVKLHREINGRFPSPKFELQICAAVRSREKVLLAQIPKGQNFTLRTEAVPGLKHSSWVLLGTGSLEMGGLRSAGNINSVWISKWAMEVKPLSPAAWITEINHNLSKSWACCPEKQNCFVTW